MIFFSCSSNLIIKSLFSFSLYFKVKFNSSIWERRDWVKKEFSLYSSFDNLNISSFSFSEKILGKFEFSFVKSIFKIAGFSILNILIKSGVKLFLFSFKNISLE